LPSGLRAGKNTVQPALWTTVDVGGRRAALWSSLPTVNRGKPRKNLIYSAGRSSSFRMHRDIWPAVRRSKTRALSAVPACAAVYRNVFTVYTLALSKEVGLEVNCVCARASSWRTTNGLR